MTSGFSGFRNSVVAINSKHAAVHQGMMFHLGTNHTALAAGGFLRFHFLTGDRTISLIGDFSSDQTLRGSLFEDVTVSADGTSVVPINRNRESSHVMQASFWTGPTITDFGTTLEDLIVITGKNGASAASVDVDWALRENTRHIIQLENISSKAAVVQISLLMHDEVVKHKIR